MSLVDLFISGQKRPQNVKIHFEDEICVICDEVQHPCAQQHIKVIFKKRAETVDQVGEANMGHMMVKAAEVAAKIGLKGYRVVVDQSENGKHVEQPMGNFIMHIVGGQQLSWPPFPQKPSAPKNNSEESKEQPEQQKQEITEDFVYEMEMGVSLVIEALIKHKKPIVGHNCMYDWVYIYN